MGFCTDDEYEEFFRSVPEFEKMLVRSGIMLVKYWFSITDEEQHRRFQMRIRDPLKQWKLSPMDLESRRRWELYTKAKEVMLQRTHIPEAPLVGGGGGRQEARPAQLHPPPARARFPIDEIAGRIGDASEPRFTIRNTSAGNCRTRCSCRRSIELGPLVVPALTDRRRPRNQHDRPNGAGRDRECHHRSRTRRRVERARRTRSSRRSPRRWSSAAPAPSPSSA